MHNDEVLEDDLLECEICLAEIPDTVTDSAEADEYVSHYCGLDCYQKLRERSEK